MNDDKVKLFRAQRDVSATIERENVRGEKSAQANAKLADIGNLLNPVPNGMKYMGSACVHVYWNETLQQAAFASQASGLRTFKCSELLAQSAMTDLMGTTMEAYGHKRPKKRSGF